jgi:hypothetical protein
VQGAEPDFLEPDDLVKILQLISSRLRKTHTQSKVYIQQLTLTASRLLDAMADTKVKGLDREKLHEPLLGCLEKWKHSSDPFLVYQAAYAFQALQTIPDNETPWQEALRRTGKVFKGVSGLVSAAKALNITDFIEGLENIQEGLDVVEVIEVARNAYVTIASVVGGGKDFMECIREGFSFRRKCAWYPMLRMADALIRDGELESFKKLVCEAPCRLDLEFQWGVCQRLADIAVNHSWQDTTRRDAVTFLVHIYQNERDWGRQLGIKRWIIGLLLMISTLPDHPLPSKYNECHNPWSRFIRFQ